MVAQKGQGYTKVLTVSLQKRAQDICNAYNEVDNVKKTLMMVRENIDSYHKKWFDAAVALGQKVNASDPQLPRHCVKLQEVMYQVTHQRCTSGVL